MNGNFKYTLDDDQRLVLCRYVTGKEKSRALATRKQVCDFLQGALDRAVQAAEEPYGEHPLATVGPDIVRINKLATWAQEEADRLRAAGKNDSYIRGWLQVMARGRAA